jgi:hypothetical protein
MLDTAELTSSSHIYSQSWFLRSLIRLINFFKSLIILCQLSRMKAYRDKLRCMLWWRVLWTWIISKFLILRSSSWVLLSMLPNIQVRILLWSLLLSTDPFILTYTKRRLFWFIVIILRLEDLFFRSSSSVVNFVVKLESWIFTASSLWFIAISCLRGSEPSNSRSTCLSWPRTLYGETGSLHGLHVIEIVVQILYINLSLYGHRTILFQ